ncbi:TetR/AcrR family transcriptional regulator [Arthrobacter sp. NEB 688]|uniref:TetR/AcrR family transcriptional regulator n=1 Tax=Arthrobacter sp. NEB 688 TaxID=904039 RepID=UPI0015644AE8|nr:TetR/AcrR family transcriptional regulator [Arthrobacter sp. NEB 688]QKE83307.1 TetR/AcrR family transcriptional regulator [Arthrobacter sp. NEB 688]
MPPPRQRPPRPVRAPRPGAAHLERDRSARGPREGRRRASHSLDSVLTEAVALLDEHGEAGLNFRALAARLGGGVGSVYWYVSSKDELLDRAADHVLADVLTRVTGVGTTGDTDPVDDVRTIAVTLFDAIVERPWLGSYFLRDTRVQPNAIRLYEKIGQQVLRLGLDDRRSFHAVSAVIGFVIGVAADMGQQTPPAEVASGEMDRAEFLAAAVDGWRALDPDQFPYLHRIADEFAVHDDADQFRAGLDLLLAGLRLQAGR